MKIKTAIIVLGIMLFLALPVTASDDNIPFSPGEKMIFRVMWAFVVAGEATLEFLPYEEFEGAESCHFVFTVRTSEFVDMFYKVRDRIESFTDRDMTRSLYYKKKHAGKSKKEITITFNWNESHAQYSDGINSHDPLPIMPNTFDPLSVFYAFRLYMRELDSSSIIHVSDGKKCITGNIKIIKREKIRVNGIEYNTVLVEPYMENIGGVFEKTRDSKLMIWVTDDDLHIPVRIKSKVKVGSFTAELESYSSGHETAVVK